MPNRHFRETPAYSDLPRGRHLTALRASPKIGSYRAAPAPVGAAGATV